MLEKIERIIRTIRVLNSLKHEQGRYRLGEISQWAKMPRITCDRYLKEMAIMGLIEISWAEYKGGDCRFFSLSEEAEHFAKIYGI